MKRIFLSLVITLFFFPSLLQARQGVFFDRAIFVIFENNSYNDTMKKPFFKNLANKGALFTNFYAIRHPSQPNYVALTSGSTQGVYSDKYVTIDSRNIVDLLEENDVSWGVYLEEFPGSCYLGKSKNGYTKKHNPFISYLNIQDSPERCSHINDVKQFDLDIKNKQLPEYVFYVPNNKDNGHNTNASYADTWYKKTFKHLIDNQNFMKDTVLITTFDEGSYFSNNQIYTTIYGPMVQPGKYNDKLNLYSLLKLVEDNWDLGDLGKNDKTATPIPNIWLTN